MTQSPEISAAVPLLSANSLAFSYSTGVGKPTIDNVSLRIHSGELIMIVGPNGSGKSTLLRLLINEFPPDAGAITLNGKSPRELGRPKMAQLLSIVPQQSETTLAFSYTVREIILMARHAANSSNAGLFNIGFETEEDLDLANKTMWAADIHHLAHRPITTLSGGERQRVNIARAFTQNTPLMLLDEPTSSLDLHHQLELMSQLQSLPQQSRSALMTTHDLNLANTFATRVIVMDQGKIIAEGPPQQILTPELLEPIYRVKITRTADGTLHFTRRQ